MLNTCKKDIPYKPSINVDINSFDIDSRDIEKDIEYLVFEGGGIRGVAFGGALKLLEEIDLMHQIKGVAGSSAGSIVAGAVAVGYTSKEIIDLLKGTDFNSFKDGGMMFAVKRLLWDYGYYKGDAFKQWYAKLIGDKTGNPDITFQEVFDKYNVELVITGSCINKAKSYYFHHKNYPDLPIVEAVRMSMSIPIVFQPIVFNKPSIQDKAALDVMEQTLANGKCDKTKVAEIEADEFKPKHEIIKLLQKCESIETKDDLLEFKVVYEAFKAQKMQKGDTIVDGGLFNNYPVWIFDTKLTGDELLLTDKLMASSKTLGLKLMTDHQHPDYQDYYENVKIDNFEDMLKCLINSTLDQIERGHIHKYYWDRTVCINTFNVSSLDFDVPIKTKEKLVDSGYHAARYYFHCKLSGIPIRTSCISFEDTK